MFSYHPRKQHTLCSGVDSEPPHTAQRWWVIACTLPEAYGIKLLPAMYTEDILSIAGSFLCWWMKGLSLSSQLTPHDWGMSYGVLLGARHPLKLAKDSLLNGKARLPIPDLDSIHSVWQSSAYSHQSLYWANRPIPMYAQHISYLITYAFFVSPV